MARSVELIELKPHEVEAVLRDEPIVFVPYGTVEWHGPQMAVGNDAIKTDLMCRRIAERTGGVVMPPVYLGCETHQVFGFGLTLQFDDSLTRHYFSNLFRELEKFGFKMIVVVLGHAGGTDIDIISRAAVEAEGRSKAKYLFFAECDISGPAGYPGDHAAVWETSVLMHLRPDLVDMTLIPDKDYPAYDVKNRLTSEFFKETGIYGEDPRGRASAELGKKIVETIVDGAVELVEGIWTGRIESYRPHWYGKVERFKKTED